MPSLLTNIHEGANGPPENQGKLHLVSGTYEYYHYLCDGFDDRVGFLAILTRILFAFVGVLRLGTINTVVTYCC